MVIELSQPMTIAQVLDMVNTEGKAVIYYEDLSDTIILDQDEMSLASEDFIKTFLVRAISRSRNVINLYKFADNAN